MYNLLRSLAPIILIVNSLQLNAQSMDPSIKWIPTNGIRNITISGADSQNLYITYDRSAGQMIRKYSINDGTLLKEVNSSAHIGKNKHKFMQTYYANFQIYNMFYYLEKDDTRKTYISAFDTALNNVQTANKILPQPAVGHVKLWFTPNEFQLNSFNKYHLAYDYRREKNYHNNSGIVYNLYDNQLKEKMQTGNKKYSFQHEIKDVFLTPDGQIGLIYQYDPEWYLRANRKTNATYINQIKIDMLNDTIKTLSFDTLNGNLTHIKSIIDEETGDIHIIALHNAAFKDNSDFDKLQYIKLNKAFEILIDTTYNTHAIGLYQKELYNRHVSNIHLDASKNPILVFSEYEDYSAIKDLSYSYSIDNIQVIKLTAKSIQLITVPSPYRSHYNDFYSTYFNDKLHILYNKYASNNKKDKNFVRTTIDKEGNVKTMVIFSINDDVNGFEIQNSKWANPNTFLIFTKNKIGYYQLN
jgi:hypothetical protein